MVRLLLAFLGCDPAALDPIEFTDRTLAGCHALAPQATCLPPFPSDEYLQGGQVFVPEAALPLYERETAGVSARLDYLSLHPAGGFSPFAPILAGFDAAVPGEDLVGYTEDPAASLLPSSPTLLWDVDRAEAVAHFAEMDPMADASGPRLLVIRPWVRLRDGARYVVAVSGLDGVDGEDLPVPLPMQALAQGRSPSHWAARQARYDAQIFPAIDAAGRPRESLQLAWDFTVRPREDATSDLLQARQIALDTFQDEGVAVVVNSVTPGGPGGKTVIEGQLQAPLVTLVDEPATLLARDEQGDVMRVGTATVSWLAVLPETGPGDAPLHALQFGHGFFGDRFEAVDHPGDFALRSGRVVFAVDWEGMSRADASEIGLALVTDPPQSFRLVDRLVQGFVNQLALEHAIRTSLAELPDFQREGTPTYDPETLGFLGISNGHMLGGVFAALSASISRVVLESGGMGYAEMMFRAVPFASFKDFLLLGLPGSTEVHEFAALAALSLDRVDASMWAPMVRAEPLAGAPADREVLIELGLGDASVPPRMGEAHARALGCTLVGETPRPVWGIPSATAPWVGSGLVIHDHGLPLPHPEDLGDLSGEENEVHGATRALEATMDQIDVFLRTSTVTWTCDGVCDPQ